MSGWTEQEKILHWEPARPALLPDNELHVWWLPLQQSAARYAELEALLSEREQARAARFKYDRHRIGFTVGRGLLREMLGRYLHTDPASLRFQLGPFGKPSLAPIDGRQLCFNYSDAEDRALYVFAWDLEVGADLECLQREVAHQRIAARRFASSESCALSRIPQEEQREAFLVCWTRKEGYGKARGVGIRYALDSIELCLDCRRSPLQIPDAEVGHWVLHQIYPTEHYTGTIVHAAGTPNLRFFSDGT